MCGDFFCYISVLLLVFSLISLWSEDIVCMLSIILNMLRFVFCPRIWSFCYMSQGHLKRMCILLLLREYSINANLDPFVWWWCSSVFLLVFYQGVLSVAENRVLKSLTIIVVCLFVCSPLSSFSTNSLASCIP